MADEREASIQHTHSAWFSPVKETEDDQESPQAEKPADYQSLIRSLGANVTAPKVQREIIPEDN